MPNCAKMSELHPGKFSMDVEDEILSRQSMKGSVHVQDFLTLNAHESCVRIQRGEHEELAGYRDKHVFANLGRVAYSFIRSKCTNEFPAVTPE
jgi:hypothetical protein